MTRLLLPAILLIAGCGDSDETGCDIPEGLWNLHYEEISGDCDIPPSDELVAWDGTRGALEATPDGCTGGRSLSDDACELVLDLQCRTIDGSGAQTGVVEATGNLVFVASDRGEGTLEQTFAGVDGSMCTSRVSVVATPR